MVLEPRKCPSKRHCLARELERIVSSPSHDAHLRRSKGKAATEEMRRKEMQLRQELASDTFVKENAKRCPECNMVKR